MLHALPAAGAVFFPSAGVGAAIDIPIVAGENIIGGRTSWAPAGARGCNGMCETDDATGIVGALVDVVEVRAQMGAEVCRVNVGGHS